MLVDYYFTGIHLLVSFFLKASYAFLNLLTVLTWRTADGKLFQSFAARTEKKFLRRSVFARGTVNGIWECWCRVFGCVGLLVVNSVSLLMSRKPSRYLKVSIASPLSRRSSRVVSQAGGVFLGTCRLCHSFAVWHGAELFPAYIFSKPGGPRGHSVLRMWSDKHFVELEHYFTRFAGKWSMYSS